MSRGTVYAAWTEQLIRDICCNCGMPFAMASTFHDQRLEDGKTFTCPAGHEQHYTRKKNAEQRLREERDALQRSRDSARARSRHLQDQYDAERRSKAAIKGHLTRIRRRIANGVCPCCTRSFSNVRQHMRSQHPDYLEDLLQREAEVGR